MKYKFFKFNICRIKDVKPVLPLRSVWVQPPHTLKYTDPDTCTSVMLLLNGEDEGHYCRLTYLLMARRGIKGPKQAPLCSPRAVFQDGRGEVSTLLQVSALSIAVGAGRPNSQLALPAEASLVSHEMEEITTSSDIQAP